MTKKPRFSPLGMVTLGDFGKASTNTLKNTIKLAKLELRQRKAGRRKKR